MTPFRPQSDRGGDAADLYKELAGKIPPPNRKRVTFEFDDRSMLSMDQLTDRGYGFKEIIVRDPATGEERKMLIPTLSNKQCPHCGE